MAGFREQSTFPEGNGNPGLAILIGKSGMRCLVPRERWELQKEFRESGIGYLLSLPQMLSDKIIDGKFLVSHPILMGTRRDDPFLF